MAFPALDEIRNDDLALVVAKALALANEAAAAEGTDVAQCLVTISEESSPPTRLWRIHYGPRDYHNRRGGDLIVTIDEKSGTVQRVMRGQ